MESDRSLSVSRFRFSIRGLMILTLIVAALAASCVYINRSLNRTFGYGHYQSYDEWPRALRLLVESNPDFKNEVTPFGLDGFIDHRSIWRIKPDSELRAALAEFYELDPTTDVHPKAKELIESMPSSWGLPDFKNCKWYATPGYGSKHFEGIDLFLIADDPKTGETVVLHEWLF